MTTAGTITVAVRVHQTGLTKFMLQHWYVGWMIALFIPLMPADWLVRTEVVEVKP